MLNIPTLFRRNEDGKLIDEVTPGCEWVLAGEGVATRLYGGITLRKARDGKWEIIENNEVVDVVTPEWEHYEAFQEARDASPTPDTGFYELCGPSIKNNPEKLSWHGLVSYRHAQRLYGASRDLEGLRRFLLINDSIKGLVWHHPDGRMAKLKSSDFS